MGSEMCIRDSRNSHDILGIEDYIKAQVTSKRQYVGLAGVHVLVNDISKKKSLSSAILVVRLLF